MDDLYRDLLWLPRRPADLDTRLQALRKSEAPVGAELTGVLLHALDENALTRVARIMTRASASAEALQPLTPFRLGIVSNATTDFVRTAIIGTSPRYGMAIDAVVSGFDNALQDSIDPLSGLNQARPRAVLIALDWRGIPIRSGRSVEERVDASMSHLNAIREGFRSHSGATCIVSNIVAPPERVFGSYDAAAADSLVSAIHRFNAALAEDIARSTDVLLDVASLAHTVGVGNWLSPSQWNLAKLPFAQEFLPLYADHVCRVVAAIVGRSRRCLVLDLDNTLWGGVIGDDGISGIRLAQGDSAAEGFLELQRYALSLRDRGIVLAVSSKNDDATARAAVRDHPEMLLRENHFAVFQANWNDKPTNIAAIAGELSLGLDAFVFVDDNPFERQLVRTALPGVAVPEMPEDPALYARTLSAAGYFELVRPSAEDLNRAQFYENNARRAHLRQQVGNLDQYLASLDMEILFQPFDQVGTARIAQLINKSNQYNLTTRRYSEVEVQDMAADPSCFTLQVRLIDNQGDNGMISVVICRTTASDAWDIDTWLMSCRVLGRRVEFMVLREILLHAREAGVKRLHGSFVPTERNALVREHYEKLGFTKTGEDGKGATTWELQVANAQLPSAPMKVRRVGFPELVDAEP
jgi:FkbH-like protein